MEVICNKYKNCPHRCIHKHIHEDQGHCYSTTCASTQQKVECNNKAIRKEKLKEIKKIKKRTN